ncbi:Exportin-6 [Saguinus oedipus]|uniref:Exportin-6 n=1 Tax=Saguinus oedipus TaxID=9490 RepID=A0ABQ9UL07_SAGOE|nr:Exportin-6 [Saguinus oedipus]
MRHGMQGRGPLGAQLPLTRSLCLQKIFRTAMLFQFVNVLLQVLVHKSHDLLQEEIGIAIYNMASVDFDGFFAAFLPEFLTSCDGVDANQKSVLGRNFKMDRVRREKGLG